MLAYWVAACAAQRALDDTGRSGAPRIARAGVTLTARFVRGFALRRADLQRLD